MASEQSIEKAIELLFATLCGSLLMASDAAAQAIPNEAMELGASVYQDHCMACHGEVGGGIPGTPPLANNSRLQDDSGVITQILMGAEYMPGFAFLLSDAEIASVATYIRNSWGNDLGPVSEVQVIEMR